MNPLKQAVEQHLQDEKKKLISPKPCAVFISFNKTRLIDEVRTQLHPILGEFHHINEYLVKIYPSGDEARDAAKTIQTLISKVNDILLDTPFEQTWLNKYLEIESYGINTVHPQYEVRSLEEVAQYIEKKDKAIKQDTDSLLYIEASELAKNSVLQENKETIVTAWTDFISNNWQSSLSKKEIHGIFSTLFSVMADTAKLRDFFTSHPAHRIHQAVKNKDELLYNELKHPEEAKNTKRASSMLTECANIDEQVASRFSDNYEVFDRLSSTSKFYFRTLSEKLKDQFTITDDTLPIPFKGTNFFFPTFEKPETLLGKRSIEETYAEDDKLDKPLTKLASAFTTYLYTYAEMKQKEKFKLGLTKIARNLDTTPYHSAILKTLDNTRPF